MNHKIRIIFALAATPILIFAPASTQESMQIQHSPSGRQKLAEAPKTTQTLTFFERYAKKLFMAGIPLAVVTTIIYLLRDPIRCLLSTVPIPGKGDKKVEHPEPTAKIINWNNNNLGKYIQELKDKYPQLSTSIELAANLESANKVQPSNVDYLNKHYLSPTKNLTQNGADFVGIDGIKQALRSMAGDGHGNLTKFMEWASTSQWYLFGPNYNHYDWWMFPINRSSSQGTKYAVTFENIKDLKEDLCFLMGYRLGAILLMQSWGWNALDNKLYSHPQPGQNWKHWQVRLGKMAHSLILFEQWDLYESLKQYVLSQKVITEQWILDIFQEQKPQTT